ncbi:MAG TPA: glycosyltransferase family 39 protein [Thermoanaerobaculia bacterium]
MKRARTPRPSSPPPAMSLPGAAHAAILGAAFLSLLAWTWGTWPDVLVDFGRELYVPWQITQGKRLYLDLAWFNGPLSPHWNALMFSLFGVGLRTLVWVNAALFALILWLLWSLLRSFGSRESATIACLLVLATCGFGQLVGIGNYNYICPYSHEVTHGLLLGLAALVLLRRWSDYGRLRELLAGASLVGLCFLTKPEMFIAAFAASAVVVALRLWNDRGRIPAAAGVFVLGLVLPVLLAGGLLSLVMPTGTAWRGTLGAWPSLFATEVAASPFYRAGSGLDAPAAHMSQMLWGTVATAGLLLPGVLLGLSARRSRHARVTAWIAFAIVAVAVAVFYDQIPWVSAAKPWPLLCLGVLVAAILRLRAGDGGAAPVAAVGFAIFSLALLGKMLLNARLYHYGFALAMPALALLTVVLYDWIPRWVANRGGTEAVAKAGLLPVLLAFALAHLSVTSGYLAGKREWVAAGPDAFRADARAHAVKAALDWIAANPVEGQRRPTVLVVPEGVMINYLARSENPTPFVNFMPPEMILFGEPPMLAALESHPPDVVVITHKRTHEYGLPWFGRDYARDLAAWLQGRYRVVQIFGDPPLQPASRFGIAVLARNTEPADR